MTLCFCSLQPFLIYGFRQKLFLHRSFCNSTCVHKNTIYSSCDDINIHFTFNFVAFHLRNFRLAVAIILLWHLLSFRFRLHLPVLLGDGISCSLLCYMIRWTVVRGTCVSFEICLRQQEVCLWRVIISERLQGLMSVVERRLDKAALSLMQNLTYSSAYATLYNQLIEVSLHSKPLFLASWADRKIACRVLQIICLQLYWVDQSSLAVVFYCISSQVTMCAGNIWRMQSTRW